MGETLFSVDLRQGAEHGLIFAIGDVHGRLDLLQSAADVIRQYPGTEKKFVVLLGDYIDRGADSRGVIEFLSSRRAGRLTCLKGNHEQMLLSVVASRDPRQFQMWLSHGGDQTLKSYGGAPTMESLDRIPSAHIQWLASLPQVALDEHRIYVHAGLVPGERYVDQTEEELLWVRERFLRSLSLDDFPDGRHIVHGHTPQWEGKRDPEVPELLEHRTNLDTGAYATGTLTVAVFDPSLPGGPFDVLAIRNSHDR